MPKTKSSSKYKSKSETLKYLPHTNSLSKSKSSIIKIRKKLEDIKPLPSVKKSKMKTKMILKKLPIKIKDIKKDTQKCYNFI